MGISIRFDNAPKGTKNLITDVPGVLVGHKTIAHGKIQTGVTAILPHSGDLFHEKVPAAVHVINGFGKSSGLMQVQELGTIETPLLLTNTLSVGTCFDALARYMVERNPDICDTTSSVNPMVLECNDSVLNDTRGFHVTQEDAYESLAAADSNFEEGAVGGGRGMCCYQMKGGIGSASRVVCLDGRNYCVGALVMTNFGSMRDLIIAGDPVGKKLTKRLEQEADKGSIITVLATDIPLTQRQLARIARRAVIGISRTGGHTSSGSGEVVVAFSTGNRMPHEQGPDILSWQVLSEQAIDKLFRPTIGCVEEAVISSLFHAETVKGRAGHTVKALGDIINLQDYCHFRQNELE